GGCDTAGLRSRGRAGVGIWHCGDFRGRRGDRADRCASAVHLAHRPAARIPEATVKASATEATPYRRFGRRRDDVTLSEGLLERAKEGDRVAFEELFTPHATDAFRLAVVMLQRREDAEDAVRNAMLKAWRKLCTFRTGCDVRPRVLTIL